MLFWRNKGATTLALGFWPKFRVGVLALQRLPFGSLPPNTHQDLVIVILGAHERLEEDTPQVCFCGSPILRLRRLIRNL